MSGLAPEFDLLQTKWPVQAASDEVARRTLNVAAPFSGEAIAQVDVAAERHVQDALFAAFSMFRQKDRWLSANRRIGLLERACELIDENAELLAKETARESGKPIRYCALEVERAMDHARVLVSELQAHVDNQLPAGPVSVLDANQTEPQFSIAEPLGVVVAVLSRNNPLELAARAMFAALAAGCPIIVKPAEDTPLSCLRLVQILHEAGLPYVWCQSVVTETHELTAQLVSDPRVALVSFSGRPDVGWGLRSSLPPGTRCLLNHGSVTPAIVAADADMRATVETISNGGFLQSTAAGESIQRVFVLHPLAETFGRALAQRASRIVVGDPLLPETELGALVKSTDAQRLQKWVDEATAGGGEVLCGGKAAGANSYMPTVVINPPIDAALSTQIVGGPIIALFEVANIDEACDRANALPLARSACVFSASHKTTEFIFSRLDATAVVVNAGLDAVRDTRSSAGLRRSGLGGAGVIAAFTSMQVQKSMVLRDRAAD